MNDITAFIHDAIPLCRTLGVTAEEVSAARVGLSLAWSEELCTGGGRLHGGVVMALADSAGAVCAYLNLPEGASGTTTIESKTNFVAGVPGGAVIAVATPLHLGRSTAVIDTTVSLDDGSLVAKVRQTQSVLWPRE